MYHTVVKGDTLSKIANRYGVTTAQLLEWNPEITDPNLIKVGQVIRVSAPEEPADEVYTKAEIDAIIQPLIQVIERHSDEIMGLDARVTRLEEPYVPDPDPPSDEDWPDEFMSYDLSGPISLSGQSNVTIEGYSFEGLAYPQRPITLNNCHGVTIRRVDSRRCSMGLVYAVNCSDITIEYCRTENITGPHERVGANRANFYQFNNVDGFYCHHLKGRYGDTEDVFSHYASRNGILEDVQWEGAIATNQPTTDGGASIPWRSGSGTGAICGDGGGSNSHDVIVRRATFLNPGQVGIAIAGGQNCGFEDCIVVSNGNPPTQSVNVGAYVWNQYPGTCSGHWMTGNRVKFHNNNHFWNGANCGNIVQTGSVWGDNSLDPEDYRVLL